MTEVVAALIWEGDRFLICQRPAHKSRGLLWEFVGGKVESGESREELGITVAVEDLFTQVDHRYPDIHIRLYLYNCTIAQGIPQLLEHNDLAWIYPHQIPEFSFCPADEEILRLICCRFDS